MNLGRIRVINPSLPFPDQGRGGLVHLPLSSLYLVLHGRFRKMMTKHILGAKIGYPVQIRIPELHTLRNISSHLKGQWCRNFEKMHGNLLRILEIETQLEALEALI
ncbi:hypothetical protein CR513_41267, partial [Mucuna pruriens]